MMSGQFVLGGVTFGTDRPIRVERFDPGARALTTQDQQPAGRSGRLMGRDFDDAPEWQFDLVVETERGGPVFEHLGALREAWQGPASPGELTVLRYRIHDRARRVFGRPRRFYATDVVAWDDIDRMPVTVSFQLADPLIYDDVERSLELGLVASGGSGVVLPAVLPWELGRAAGQRQGVVEVGGRAPAPFSVTFQGPTSGFASSLWAQGPGWRVDLDTQLSFGQSVTVDTRACTVTRSDGVSLVGAARGRFLTARLVPGAQELAWGATDPSNTARAVFAWHDAYYSI